MAHLSQLTTQHTKETVDFRRDFHAHPEVAFEETRTAAIVAAHLSKLGLEVRTGVGKTGVIGILDTGKPGPTVLARADFDALPVAEETHLPFASTTPGKMHACGHDAHTAILLSTASVLTKTQEQLTGKLVMLFQPAEEIGAGAQAMLDDGALDGITLNHVIGLHITTLHPLGEVHVDTGPMMAATDTIEITLSGVGGHAAMPPHFVDPVVASAQLITALQTIVSRETDPIDQSVLSFGVIHGGTVANVIPEQVYMAGTLRSFDEQTRERLKTRITEITNSIAAAMRCEVDIQFTEGTDAVVNEASAVEHFRSIAANVVGANNVRKQVPMMGGDDMALWLRQAPGVYFWLGASSGEATSYAHHHPKFDIDEKALPIGVELLSTAIADLLS